MKWIIENLVKEESYLELSAAAKELGCDVLDIQGDYTHADIATYYNEEVIFMGCIEMCKIVGDKLKEQGCYPVIYGDPYKFLCSQFYWPLQTYLFNDNFSMTPLIDLYANLSMYYDRYGKDNLIFVRPDSGEKTFKAGLVNLNDFEFFYQQNRDYCNDLVIISSPKTIKGEWRFLCNIYDILAVSSYRIDGKPIRIPAAPAGAEEVCREILDVGYYPASIFCVDVAEDADGNFWLLELTSFNAAGLYKMDPVKVIQGINKYHI